MLKVERKFPYLRIQVTGGEVRKLPIRKKNPGELSASCQECAAPPGCGCDPASPVVTEMIRMAKSPPLMVHTRRMADAITAGAVSRHAIVAQFQGNPMPVAVARAVSATRRRPA